MATCTNCDRPLLCVKCNEGFFIDNDSSGASGYAADGSGLLSQQSPEPLSPVQDWSRYVPTSPRYTPFSSATEPYYLQAAQMPGQTVAVTMTGGSGDSVAANSSPPRKSRKRPRQMSSESSTGEMVCIKQTAGKSTGGKETARKSTGGKTPKKQRHQEKTQEMEEAAGPSRRRSGSLPPYIKATSGRTPPYLTSPISPRSTIWPHFEPSRPMFSPTPSYKAEHGWSSPAHSPSESIVYEPTAPMYSPTPSYKAAHGLTSPEEQPSSAPVITLD